MACTGLSREKVSCYEQHVALHGALLMFNKHFVKSEIFERNIAKFVKEDLDKRLLGDYEIGYKASREDALLAVEHAKAIIHQIRTILMI